jgi:hypothetical protein
MAENNIFHDENNYLDPDLLDKILDGNPDTSDSNLNGFWEDIPDDLFDPNPTIPVLPLPVSEIASEIKSLLKTKYLVNRQEHYNRLINLIQILNIKKELLLSLEEGYAGFEIIQDPWIGTFTTAMNCQIKELIEQKLAEQDINNDVARFIICGRNTLLILPIMQNLLTVEETGDMYQVIHKNPRIGMNDDLLNLKARVKILESENSQLKAEIGELYQPDQIGAIKSYKHYINSSEICKN